MQTITFFTETELKVLEKHFYNFYKEFLKEQTWSNYSTWLSIDNVLKVQNALFETKNSDNLIWKLKTILKEDMARLEESNKQAEELIQEKKQTIKEKKETLKILESSETIENFIKNLNLNN